MQACINWIITLQSVRYSQTFFYAYVHWLPCSGFLPSWPTRILSANLQISAIKQITKINTHAHTHMHKTFTFKWQWQIANAKNNFKSQCQKRRKKKTWRSRRNCWHMQHTFRGFPNWHWQLLVQVGRRLAQRVHNFEVRSVPRATHASLLVLLLVPIWWRLKWSSWKSLNTWRGREEGPA